MMLLRVGLDHNQQTHVYRLFQQEKIKGQNRAKRGESSQKPKKTKEKSVIKTPERWSIDAKTPETRIFNAFEAQNMTFSLAPSLPDNPSSWNC